MPKFLSPISKSKRGWLVCLTAGLLLLAQAAMAAQGCMLMKAAPQAMSMAMAECGGVPMDSGACVARCHAGDQAAGWTDHQAQFVLPLPPVAASSFALPANLAGSARAAAMDVPRGPPFRILFCSYQI